MVSAILHLKKNKIIQVEKSILVFLIVLTAILGSLCGYALSYSGKIFPNIYVSGVNVGGLSPAKASVLLSEKIQAPGKINLIGESQPINLKTSDIDLVYDDTGSALRAYNFTRTGNIFEDLRQQVSLLVKAKYFGLLLNLDETKLHSIISVVSGQVSQNPVNPSLELSDGQVSVERGSAGTLVDSETLRTMIGQDLTYAKSDDIKIPVKIIDPSLTKEQSEFLKSRALKLVGKNIQIIFEYSTFNYSTGDLFSFLNPKSGYNEGVITGVVSNIAASVNRDPQNPKFEFSGGRVSEFQPALDGIKVDETTFVQTFETILIQLENGSDKTITFQVPVIKTSPDIATDKVNNLGIKELIGRGTSTYFHSIPGRVYNVVLAASRINGTLVAPGSTFSFNNTLGDVSAFTGYQQAYIISGGRTVLGDGGGVCQVSTTLFRALLNAGLPINERAAHAYRVGYYEQNSPPGLDATVYGPSPDLKFTNDTPAYILIEAQSDPKNYSLVFELYGTGDGRVSTITKPFVTNITPPLPTVYQDEPTLPAGTLKQTDFPAGGAKVTFNYSVTRDGQNIYQKTFVSNYQPWAAVYLRGTGPTI